MRRREATDDLFVVPIESIRIRAKSRDDIPALLRGLQHLYVEKYLREEVFALLAQHVAAGRDHANGRPGMMLWQILVLAGIKQDLDFDYDRLEELANEHHALRLMLQHVPEDQTEYSFRTLCHATRKLPVKRH